MASGTINHNSGKSIGCLHALVRHCYEEKNALALIIAPQIRTGKEGVIADLQWVLDIWKNGNWKDENQNLRADEGIGIDYTEPALDAQTKDRVIFIGNVHGGWSKVILVSIPYPEVVAKRMKALSPSFVYADEMTELAGPEYFTYVAQQIGRRRNIVGIQQYYASTNPEGPSHWVYKVYFDDCVDKITGKRDSRYAVFHVPVKENEKHLPPGYVDDLKDLYKDPADRERLLFGRWVDRASGQAIFKNYYRPEIHVRPTPLSIEDRRGDGLLPLRGFPIMVSYDPGPVNFCVTFEQMIITKQKRIWIAFDELNFVGQYKPDFVVVPKILTAMDLWNAHLGGTASFVHIADEAAWTHFRGDGSTDAARIQQLSNNRIWIRGCPKGKESVPARVQMTINLFLEDSLFISARCPRLQEMFRLLISKKVKDGEYDANAGLRPLRSPYLHAFDSFSYAPFYFMLNPAAFILQTGNVNTPEVYRAGQS